MLLRRLEFLAWLAAVVIIVIGGSYALAPQWLVRAGIWRQALAAHVTAQTVDAGGIPWAYYAGGEGPTLVLLHGMDQDKTAWLAVASQLTAHFHVLIPDLPGWGDTPAAEPSSTAKQAAALDGFMQALQLRDVVLVGHGTGGALAAVYAATHPQRVRELALLDAYGLSGKPDAFASTATSTPLFVYDDRAQLAQANATLWATPPTPYGRLADVRIAHNRAHRAFITATLAKLQQSAELRVTADHLDALTMPVLGLWCHNDPVIGDSALERLRDGLTRSTAISASVINGCRHLPMLEQPDVTAQILTRFALSH